MKIIIACILSFAVSAITGKFLVPELRKLKAGQSIREDGPTWHAGKAGTPTMGGLMFILGIFVSILICGWKGMMAGDFEHLYIFFFALIFGGILVGNRVPAPRKKSRADLHEACEMRYN